VFEKTPLILLYRFMFLGTHFNYPSQLLSLATKVVVNQLVFTPIFNSYFFGMQTVLSNLPDFSLQRTWEHIQRTVPVSFVNSCKLWPAVTAFSFTFIGPMYRSIFAGVIAIGWQVSLIHVMAYERKNLHGFIIIWCTDEILDLSQLPQHQGRKY
jgi:hypothetical protein